MPFFANTPESLLYQSGSTSSTCRGITSNGQPCRRPLALAAPASRPKRSDRLTTPNPSDESLYCWQHKDQAGRSPQSSPAPRPNNTPVLDQHPQARSSIDTLADRLGIIRRHTTRLSRRRKTHRYDASSPEPKPSPTRYEYCCCFRIPIEEEYVPEPPTRPRPNPVQRPPRSSVPTTPGQQQQQGSSRPNGQGLSPQSPAAAAQPSKHSASAASSRTAGLMSLIPASTSPQTASLLMAEMAKPVSAGDEPGYIYIFWLTPESQKATAPTVDAARSMFLSPSSPLTRPGPGSGGQRRPSDVVASFAARGLDVGGDDDDGDGDRGGRARGIGTGGSRSRSASQKPSGKKTILLKIGRATNVQRRLNEWQRQCGYDLSLIRYYPYISSSGSPAASPAATPGTDERRRRSTSAASSPGELPRKMPHSHKVERLVHIELAGLGLRVADREKCPACGREHREWFEVEASRRAVRTVDEVVRRWVEWDEGKT